MMKLLTKSIWPSMKKIKGPDKAVVIVAYVTADHLNLGEGDILICDASNVNVASGVVSATVLEKLFKEGVALFSFVGLHAKLVLTSTHVLVGSANMSQNTSRLLEASVLSDDPVLLKESREFVEKVLVDERLISIDEEELRRLLEIPVVVNKTVQGGVREAQLWVSKVDDLPEEKANEVAQYIGSFSESGAACEDQFIVFSRKDSALAKSIGIDDYFISVDEGANTIGPQKVKATLKWPEKGKRKGEQIVIVLEDSEAIEIPWKTVRLVLSQDDGGASIQRSVRPKLTQLCNSALERIEQVFSS
ncbi:hypothetical protein [Alcaligenes faecalis]|uniref:hypothetical protein n=1 Tax=Alcaligenes faecalis TaxID=511 RepID=UPI001C8388BD|nr:hypothetical protein [Alcaligenes faecalis]MBX6963102.1 hypothetical protein [Providencia rettgeri]MBX7029752.1 hypothetical protein [Alcaligenes faecalis]